MTTRAVTDVRHPKLLWWFLALWTLLNVLTGTFANLADDEGYYWMWSQYPAIGYFDHPPMIAFFIRPGYALIHDEVGVRLLVILSSTAVLYMIYRMTGPERLRTLILIAVGTLLVHVGGIFAAPDVPLVFFVTLFFFVWKRYLEKDSWLTAGLIALILAAVMYSKYHGVFVLFFAVIANPRIWRRPSFWVAVVVSIGLYVPHVHWLFTDGYASIEWNRENRMTDPLDIREVGMYIAGVLLLAGPLVGFLTVPAAFRQKAHTPFFRTLKYSYGGVLITFLAFSLIGHVEPNWVSSAFVPMIVLSTFYIHDRPKLRKWLFWLAVPSFILLMFLRLNLMSRMLPLDPAQDKTAEFRGWETFAEKCKERAGSTILTTNTFQLASKLTFYTDTLVPSLRIDTRADQYAFWRFDDALEGKEITYVFNYPPFGYDSIPAPDGRMMYFNRISNYRSYNEVELTLDKPVFHLRPGQDTLVRVHIMPPVGWTPPPRGHVMAVSYDYWDGERTIARNVHSVLVPRRIIGPDEIMTRLKAPEEPGEYTVLLYLQQKDFTWWERWEAAEVVVDQD